MDRIEALTLFAAVAEEHSFAAAARRLGRSPAAVTRAIADLENRLGVRLFNRTTRAVALTEAGGETLERCRRLLAEVEALETAAADRAIEPRGLLAVTAPIVFGRRHVLPIVTEFLIDCPAVEIRLLLLDRPVSLVDEGIDVGVRIGRLPDSSLRAIRAGSVRRSAYASPDYLASQGTPARPGDLTGHRCIAFTGFGRDPDRWRFGTGEAPETVQIQPRLTVNTAEAAIDAAVAGLGITVVLSYQAVPALAAGHLVPILEAFEPAPLPIQVIHPAGRHLPAKTRRFIDRAVAALRKQFD